MADLGSGCLVPMDQLGINHYEPTVAEMIKWDVDVVTFSGDKLLGGPQAGIIMGKRKYISPMKENPLARALRIDKLTVAALEATLWDYVMGQAGDTVPTLKMLKLPEKTLYQRAEELQYKLQVFAGLEADVEACTSWVGGGSLPLLELSTYAVLLEVPGMNPELLISRLREGDPPVIAMIREDKVVFDMRTIKDGEIPLVASCVAKAIQ